MKKLLRFINIITVVIAIGFVPLVLRQYLSIKTSRAIDRQEILNGLKIDRRPRRKRDYSLIVQRNPFGLKGEVSVQREEKPQQGPSSLEGYKLLGTISDGHGRGYAFIEDPQGKQDFYRSGQEIEGIGPLKGVWPGYVLLGQPPRRLNLVELQASGAGSGTSPSVKPPSKRNIRRRRFSLGDLDRFIQRRGENEFVLDRQKVEEALENPQQLMTDARLQPAFRNGKQYGFVLRNVKPNGIYAKLGLRNGDVLLKINEFDITDPETALRAFNELRGADEIELHIRRGGREQTLRYLIE